MCLVACRRLFSERPCCFSAPSGVRKCGACCRAFPGWNLTAPCLPGLPVIPEFNGGGAPTSPIGAGLRAPNIGDPCEVVAKSIVGDSFPEADWHQVGLTMLQLTSLCCNSRLIDL